MVVEWQSKLLRPDSVMVKRVHGTSGPFDRRFHLTSIRKQFLQPVYCGYAIAQTCHVPARSARQNKAVEPWCLFDLHPASVCSSPASRNSGKPGLW